AATGPARALRVVRRRWRHVAQTNRVEVGDVDAELHGGRAVKQRQLAGPELVLTLEPVALWHLGGVLAGKHACVATRQVAVQVAEERVDPRRLLATECLAEWIRRAGESTAG